MSTLIKIVFGILVFWGACLPCFFLKHLLFTIEPSTQKLATLLLRGNTDAVYASIGFLIFLAVTQTDWFDRQEKKIEKLFK